MSDETSISIELPLDDEGFLRRECPTCGEEFKWLHTSDDDPESEPADQYFCPRCGVAAGLDQWWTPEQIEFAQAAVAKELGGVVQDAIRSAFKSNSGVRFVANPDFEFEFESPSLTMEPNDMVIVESPCHPREPIKVPEELLGHLYCLVCGRDYAA